MLYRLVLSVLLGATLLPVALLAQDRATLPYEGSARAAAKTTMLDRPVKRFKTIRALRRKMLTKDKIFLKRHPKIGADRLPEERHVVQVKARLIAVKFETAAKKGGDNDFHLILGDADGGIDSLLNVEISGIPKTGDPGRRFEAVRRQLIEILRDADVRVTGAYERPAAPLFVTVVGSIFFDRDHKAGVVGPKGSRPTTAWEIHPVHSIVRASGQ